MPKYPSFCGGTYQGRDNTAASDRCENWYPESTGGTGEAENNYVLLPTAGNTLFASATDTKGVQGLFTEPATNRMFAVIGDNIHEFASNGTVISYGTIGSGPYSFASNSLQIMIACAGDGTGWIFTLGSNALTQITNAGYLGAAEVVMIDNYFITRLPSSREIQISALQDGTTWDASDIAFVEGGPENLVGMLADHRELWLFGSRHAEIFVDTGATNFPFERLNSTFIEQGCAASRSLIQLDNTIYWLGTNQHGQCRVFMNNGYVPVGVSNRSVEWFFNEYARNGGVSDAVAFGYQDESGHTFYVISFPSATSDVSADGAMQTGVIKGATWAYDVGEKMWHERPYLNQTSGMKGNAIGIYHTFAFGKHLVAGGDSTGNIYHLSTDIYTDNGNVIARRRVAPHLTDELKTISIPKFRLSCQTGTGSQDDPNNVIVLRTSRDGGKTWSNEYNKSLGNTGEYDKIVEWRALGRSRRRVIEVSTTIKAPIALVDAYIEVQEGTH